MKFGLKHIPIIGCIELGDHAAQDRNRSIKLKLNAIPPDQRGKLDVGKPTELKELGEQIMAASIWAGA